MKNLVKKILMEYVEENDSDKNLSFTEAKHIITKILPSTVRYNAIDLDGGKFKSGSMAILGYLKNCHRHDPNVKFDLVEVKPTGFVGDDTPIEYKVIVHSDKIRSMINRNRNIDLSDWS